MVIKKKTFFFDGLRGERVRIYHRTCLILFISILYTYYTIFSFFFFVYVIEKSVNFILDKNKCQPVR